jgi:hypothetical protein
MVVRNAAMGEGFAEMARIMGALRA